MKTYCQNCKYNRTFGFTSLYCENPELHEEKGNSFTGSLKRVKSTLKTKLNSKGACPHYHRLWWKVMFKHKNSDVEL